MDLELIIRDLLVSDTSTIQKATKELEQALKQTENIISLCNIMASHVKSEYRQMSAILLKKHFQTVRHYKELTLQTRQNIKDAIVDTIFKEKDNIVRGGMVQFLAVVLFYEIQNDDVWVSKVIAFIVDQCYATDTQTVEVGTFVFGKLADIVPSPFIQRFSAVREIFQGALFSVNFGSETNISATVMFNVLTAMSALVTGMLGCREAEHAYKEAVPHLVNVINKFAREKLTDHFTIALDVLHNMSEYTPVLLNQHIQILIEFTLALSTDCAYDPDVRIKALNFICVMVEEKKKLLSKLNLIEPIMDVVFNIMASEPESNDADEFFVESEIETPLAAATVVLDTMAAKMPPNKFIPPLLTLLEPALNSTTDELRRRAAYIALATISEGCSEAICENYLESMLNILKQGLNDPVIIVRNAALFAVGQFSIQLQPEIANYASEVFPLLLKHMQDILQAHETGQQLPSKNAERVFYALEEFCDNMEESLAPYMENLMCMILKLLSGDYQQRMKFLAMALTEAAAKAFKGSVLPWFQPLMDNLRPMLLQDKPVDTDGLRSQAINTLAAVARNTDKQFMPFAAETMEQCVIWIENTEDIDLRRSLINLFGALATVVGQNFTPILPVVLKHINRCLEEDSDSAPDFTKNNENGDARDNDIRIELDDETSDDGGIQFPGDNPYSEAKLQSIQTIQELAESCMKMLLPFAPNLFKTLFKMLEHSYADIRKSSITALKTFTIKLVQCNPDDNSKQALNILLNKLKDIVRKDEHSDIVIEAQEGISDIISELGTVPLPNKANRNSIAQCIKEGLTYEYKCLCAEDNSSEQSHNEGDCKSVTLVVEGAASLLTSLGMAVEPAEFAEYFRMLEPYIMKHVHNGSVGEMKVECGYFIGVLADCYAILGKNVGSFFEVHIKLMINASKQTNPKIRENGIFGLGVLMHAGNEISYNYFPVVLENLSQILTNEKTRSVIDSIIGALARLILTNAALVPVEQVIPVMLQKLPIVDDDTESHVVMECFDLLFSKHTQFMQTYTAPIVTIAIQSVAKSSCDQTLLKQVLKLLENIRKSFPADYHEALMNPILAALIGENAQKLLVELLHKKI